MAGSLPGTGISGRLLESQPFHSGGPGLVAVNPFASCPAKEWYPDKWAAVIPRDAFQRPEGILHLHAWTSGNKDKIQKALKQGAPGLRRKRGPTPGRGSTGAAPQS